MQPYNYQNPFQQQYQQQFQPQLQQQYQPFLPSINGRIVNDFADIKVSDIPTDGNPAFFIKRDLSEIEARVWTSNGSIQTYSYTKSIPIETISNKEDELSEKLNSISERVDKIEKSLRSRRKETADE